MTQDNADSGELDQAVLDLRRLAAQCRDAGLPDEGAQLLRVSRQLGPFAESPPIYREIDPFWS